MVVVVLVAVVAVLSVIVNSYRPSTLQADAHSGGGGACHCHCHLSIVVVNSYYPSTLQADARSGGGGACCHRCCAIHRPSLLSIATTHPPCKQMLAAVVVVLVTVVVTQCRHSTHKQLLEELDAGGVMLYCQKIMLQWLRHQEALTLQVSHFTGLMAPLYCP